MSVKEKKRGRPKGSGSQLSAPLILDTAKQLMRENGKVPSIRGLATQLGVDAMAIYHYFENKNALLEAITVSLMSDIYLPKTNVDWQHELKLLCVSYVSLLNRYSGLLETLLKMETLGPSDVFNERLDHVLSPLSLNDENKKRALDLLVDYLHGYALALNCNQTSEPLTPDMLDGSLHLYCLALVHA